jgi:hypothetical protein
LNWELKSLVFGLLNVFAKEGVAPPDGLHLDDVIPKFSERHLALTRFFAAKFAIEVDDILVKRIWNIVHFIHTVIVGKQSQFNLERMFELFEGKIELGEELNSEEGAILSSFRFSIAVLMCVSVGLGPDGNDEEELFQFLNETAETYRSLPLKSPELEELLRQKNEGVVSMVLEQEIVSIVRLGRAENDWAFFALESECIRGYWTNEARSILFLAMSSRERNSIQMNVHSLRNITNQSCNQPIGYPAFVTDILDSYVDID